MLEQVFAGLVAVLHWQPVIAMVGGTIIGIVLGALPGLTATMGVAMAIPFTYGMDPLVALGLLAGIHNGASQGGAIPAVLFRIPGTPAAIATTLDGYPLAQQGKAGAALQLAAASSATGGMLSALSLVLLAPPLASVVLSFGPAEIFWVNVVGLASVSALLGDDRLKGILAACLGLLLGTVGIDNVTGQERFTFGILELTSGIPQLVVMIGMFSLPPAWFLAQTAVTQDRKLKKIVIKAAKGVWTLAGVYKIWLKSSLIGIFIGILPGSGGGSAFIAYNEAKRSSRRPELFGHGSPEGLAAAESVNNADNAAAMIPALTLGVPGSGIAALMLGALLIHGFQPGPQLFRDSPSIVFGYTWAMFITALLLLPLGGIVASRVFANLLLLPQSLMLPMIICLTVAGTFAFQNSMFNVYLMLGFGVVGLLMEWTNFPIAPVVIGLILGVNMEFNMRLALLLSAGDATVLFTRPICQVLIVMAALVLFLPLLRGAKDMLWRKSARPSA